MKELRVNMKKIIMKELRNKYEEKMKKYDGKTWKYEGIMKKYVENKTKYEEFIMKKYEENMKKYEGNIKKFLPAGEGGESYAVTDADRIPEMEPSTKREVGSPAR